MMTELAAMAERQRVRELAVRELYEAASGALCFLPENDDENHARLRAAVNALFDELG